MPPQFGPPPRPREAARSFSAPALPAGGEENGNPLRYSCLENPMDRGAWRATVQGVSRVGHDVATKPPTIHPRKTASSWADIGLVACRVQFDNRWQQPGGHRNS
ncbi:uncharacterized protein ACBT57_005426 [Dama dama]